MHYHFENSRNNNLPDKDGLYIVKWQYVYRHEDNNSYVITIAEFKDGKWVVNGQDSLSISIQYWMPLPKKSNDPSILFHHSCEITDDRAIIFDVIFKDNKNNIDKSCGITFSPTINMEVSIRGNSCKYLDLNKLNIMYHELYELNNIAIIMNEYYNYNHIESIY